jgi:hypothetical protein
MIDVTKTRRVVTGFDENGKSMVAIDGPPGAILGANGAGLGDLAVARRWRPRTLGVRAGGAGKRVLRSLGACQKVGEEGGQKVS